MREEGTPKELIHNWLAEKLLTYMDPRLLWEEILMQKRSVAFIRPRPWTLTVWLLRRDPHRRANA
jgi:hypothetical protein